MNPEILKLRNELQSVKIRYYAGVATYDEMKASAQVVADKMNELGEVIAKRHGKKHRKIGTANLMR